MGIHFDGPLADRRWSQAGGSRMKDRLSGHFFWDRVTKFKWIIAENEQLHGLKITKVTKDYTFKYMYVYNSVS